MPSAVHFLASCRRKEKENYDVKNNAKGTGHIRKRDNGVWEGQYYHDGIHKSIYSTDYSALRARLNDICTAVNGTKVVVSPRNNISDFVRECFLTKGNSALLISRTDLRQITLMYYADSPKNSHPKDLNIITHITEIYCSNINDFV